MGTLAPDPQYLRRADHPVRRLKNWLLPAGATTRRLPLGIGRGVRMEIDFRTQTGLYLGLYEMELNRHLRALCRIGYRCFDVGGQHGYDALVLAKLCRQRVVSFECDAGAWDSMRRNFRANPALDPLLVAQRATVAAETDLARGQTTLDDFALQESCIPDLIKVDVEGDEASVLYGARHIICRRRPHLIVETHSLENERQCGRLLLDAGYTPKVVNARSALPDDRPTAHNRWLVARGDP